MSNDWKEIIRKSKENKYLPSSVPLVKDNSSSVMNIQTEIEKMDARINDIEGTVSDVHFSNRVLTTQMKNVNEEINFTTKLANTCYLLIIILFVIVMCMYFSMLNNISDIKNFKDSNPQTEKSEIKTYTIENPETDTFYVYGEDNEGHVKCIYTYVIKEVDKNGK